MRRLWRPSDAASIASFKTLPAAGSAITARCKASSASGCLGRHHAPPPRPLHRCRGRPRWHELSEEYAFEQYKADFGKSYAPQEDDERRVIFEARLKSILDHNTNPSTYKKGVNALTDRTDDERRALNGRDKALAASRPRAALAAPAPLAALPATFDWRDRRPSVLTAVKDQGQCGSCWAFASTETIESHVALNTGELVELAPQHLVSCAANVCDCGGTGGCGGSIAELAFEYVQTHGMATEWTYPYTAGLDGKSGSCRYNASSPIEGRGGIGIRARRFERRGRGARGPRVKGPLAVNVDAGGWHDYERHLHGGEEGRY
ncbi:transferase [Aureococcus anophagefferens]|nr:transferase [Aureococcus anophagefferens]